MQSCRYFECIGHVFFLQLIERNREHLNLHENVLVVWMQKYLQNNTDDDGKRQQSCFYPSTLQINLNIYCALYASAELTKYFIDAVPIVFVS